MPSTKRSKNKLWSENDLLYALDNAAEFLENEEFPHDNGEQVAANKEAAKRIRNMVKRMENKLVQRNVEAHLNNH